MQVGDEVRTVTVAQVLTFTAEDLAQAAGLAGPEQWKFADGGPDATATLTRHE